MRLWKAECERKPASYSGELGNAFSELTVSDEIYGETVDKTEATRSKTDICANKLTTVNSDHPYL
jgi:hypothetical protein